MPSNGLENPAGPRPVYTERSECAPSPAEGLVPSRAEGSPLSALALRHPEGRPFRPEACPACPEGSRGKPSRRGSQAIGTRTPCLLPKRPALPKLNANRGMRLLAIALTRCKQRPTALPNRGEIQMVKAASPRHSLEEWRA
jgi:hypothetical protein